MSTERFAHRLYLLMTLDPVHPGAGGYRLGRVDNSIVRDPGTRLPKIPGSSLHGAARSYAAYLYGMPDAAGMDQSKIEKPAENPICYTFGYNKGAQVSSGVVNVFDAHLLLFPVHSMFGPVWVGVPERLKSAGFAIHQAPSVWDEDKILVTLPKCSQLNLGWLLLQSAGQVQVEPPAAWAVEAWNAVAGRLVLVSPTLFSHVVNSNLEVRTSVAIDPATGAAKEGALYTYESIPRAAFLTAEVALDDFFIHNDRRPFPADKTGLGGPLPGKSWEGPLDVVEAGLRMIEYLSVGGMGTRGFGRVRIVGTAVHTPFEQMFNLPEQ